VISTLNIRRIDMRKSNNMTSRLGLAAILIVMSAVTTGCATLNQPRIGVWLPEEYNTPDGMALDADNNIILSCPNFNNDTHPAKLLKIIPNGNVVRIEEIVTLPLHPDTGKVGNLGVDIGPDGHLYVADNQSSVTNDYKSRLLRVVMKDGKAVGCEVLVTGFIQSNAVSCRADGVYVTETSLDPNATPMPSGVYRFRYSEFTGTPVELLPGGEDDHLIATLYTANEEWSVGANGLGFDSKGNMYVCNFGEASVIKFTFDENGEVASQEIFARGQGIESTDGLKVHPRTDDIYVADFVGNAVHKIDAKTREIKTLAKNAVNLGSADGQLDIPSEVCIRGNWLYISNIDLPLAGNEYDAPHTLSVIRLEN
jgi:sugar lactone lactonase YvrE